MTPLVGIFVGGAARRMGGSPKGLLASPDGSGTLVDRLRRVAASAAPGARIVLVGAHPAYAGLGLPVIADSPAGVGPIGGLAALLAAARPDVPVLALACDMPFVSDGIVLRLLRHAPDAAAVAPRVDGLWQPLCARYSPSALSVTARLITERRYSLQAIFDALGADADPLPLSAEEAASLRDWDTPEDTTR